jgi:hypothetical protein
MDRSISAFLIEKQNSHTVTPEEKLRKISLDAHEQQDYHLPTQKYEDSV